MIKKKISESTFESLVEKINEVGFVVIKNAFSKDLALDMKKELRKISNEWSPPNTGTPYLNQNTPLIYNPDHKSERILHFILRENKLLHKILQFYLNDKWYRRLPEDEPNYILRASIARSSGPNSLPLHIDSFIPSSGSITFVMQVLFSLDESTVDNGSTVVVPKSHLSNRYASQEDLKDAIPLELDQGDLAIWDSRLWHGANPNLTGQDRWSIIATFTRWWIKQNYQTINALPKSFINKLTPTEKTIMGFNSYPPLNEYDRIDIKKGHD